jgi:hypothetical protein
VANTPVLEPLPNWIPLRRAIFQFGVDDEPDDELDALLEEVRELIKSKHTDHTARPFSLNALIEMLRQRTKANELTIDPTEGTFSFSFDSSEYGSCVVGGRPWDILAPPLNDAKLDPRRQAKPSREGLIRVGKREATYHAQQFSAARDATRVVWHHFMLPTFARAVARKRVRLHARIQFTTVPFQQLPADVWPLLTVLDWPNGLASDPQGVPYYSIHAAATRRHLPGPPEVNESAATTDLAEKLKINPEWKRKDALDYCQRAFGVTERSFQYRIWPDARELAGLPRRALPGRKPKSSQ